MHDEQQFEAVTEGDSRELVIEVIRIHLLASVLRQVIDDQASLFYFCRERDSEIVEAVILTIAKERGYLQKLRQFGPLFAGDDGGCLEIVLGWDSAPDTEMIYDPGLLEPPKTRDEVIQNRGLFSKRRGIEGSVLDSDVSDTIALDEDLLEEDEAEDIEHEG